MKHLSKSKEKDLKVLILASTFPPQHTGSGLLIKGIIEKLSDLQPARFKFLVYCFTSRKVPIFENHDLNVKFYRSDKNFFIFLKGIFSFYVAFFRSDILLVINLVQPLILIAQIAALISRKKIIIEPAIQEDKLPGLARKLYKFITYRFFFKKLSSYSPGLSQVFIDYGFNGKVYDIGAQVDLDKFYPGNQMISRDDLNLNYKGKFLCTFVGAMSERKGIDRIIELLKRKDYEEEILINLVGPNTNYFKDLINLNSDLINRLIKEKKLNLVMGLNHRINEYLRASDFFLFPTRKDAFGAVLIEALASGTIPISTRIKGVTDTFLDETNSLLCSNTFESFQESFESALDLNDLERTNLINNGLKRAQEYSLENISKRYENMFLEI